MRIMGIDYGDRRMGMAISDPLGITAQGLPTIERTHLDEDIKKIVQLISENDVSEVVVGLPKHMNNSLGEKAQAVLAFIEQLKKFINVPIHTLDERLSTVRAERALLEGNLSRKKRKVRVDMVAAQLILQDYLARRQIQPPESSFAQED